MAHAARALSEDSPAVLAGRAGGGAGTDHGQRCVEGHGRADRGPAQGSGTGDRGWVQEPRRRGAGGCPRGVDCGGGRGYRRCWADPMAGLANAGTMGLTSRRGHGGRCGGGGVSGVRSGRRPVPGSPWLSGGPESHGEPVIRLPCPFFPTVGGNDAAENGSPGLELRALGPGGLIVPGGWRF